MESSGPEGAVAAQFLLVLTSENGRSERAGPIYQENLKKKKKRFFVPNFPL